ncbi:DNA-binding protein [bacterium M00.F.Ca.ET.159.01.1.1]|nr:DNA-binding protein [bacterium M00.F.Ca.ET.159.01.1.1]TGT79662.1 DNA-binding protein [bacterium M00.F.Ca.ET.157.01.1.1]
MGWSVEDTARTKRRRTVPQLQAANSNIDDEFMTLAEVKARFKISKTTVYRLMASGQFPHPAKVGRTSRWARWAIDDYTATISQKANAA